MSLGLKVLGVDKEQYPTAFVLFCMDFDAVFCISLELKVNEDRALSLNRFCIARRPVKTVGMSREPDRAMEPYPVSHELDLRLGGC